MLLRNLGRVALATAAALLPSVLAKKNNDTGQSTFVSANGDVAFAITIAENHDTDVYFTLRTLQSRSWAAVGLGSDDMPGALYLMIYRNEATTGVTFSPRLAYGNYEPKYFDEMEYELLNGTGLDDGYMTVTVRCTKHCRSWPAGGTSSGYMDVSSPSVKAIYAYGPKEGFHSNRKDAPLKYHEGYGTFTIDVGRTETTSTKAPALAANSKSDGVDNITFKKAATNWKTPLHGAVMIVCIAVLMPFGVGLLRVRGNWKWHALNQTVAMVGAFLGTALGIVNSFYYQRSRSFDSSHQMIGFAIISLLLVQFGLGAFHHTQYKKTQSPTKYGMIHIWVGRIIIFIGIMNCFIGFTFAVNRKYGMILAAIVIFMFFLSLVLMFGQKYLYAKKRGPMGMPAAQGYHHPEPWRQQQPPSHQTEYPSDPPPGYEATSSHIGLRSVSPSPWRSSDRKDDDVDLDLGSQQRPREFT
ncbi:hypothetical protein B0J13DRAFT_305633 [Dactylonectria estremocensis]|uniref:Cytochrome b561 domain-containing protein n=1 Tax=Dactylonectria estremocensis TaxID=1079267 RepID=A0A9P9F1E9_9HYPO|nr:hypothetical protein B0J13DRAFT_305633 [Dactylonectria estremocensis]